jgi:tetratricopeptide (TPR) repeat protein
MPLSPLRGPSRNHRGFDCLLFVAGFACIIGCSDKATPTTAESQAKVVPSEPPRDVVGSVLCLTTETYPTNGVFADRLLREIVRQGVLIAARDDLGMFTRDQTLGEPFPESESSVESATGRAIKPLGLSAHFGANGDWSAKLSVEDAPQLSFIWESEGEDGGDERSRYPRLVAAMTEASASIAQSLTVAGAESTSKSNADSAPTAEVEALLGEMNFVSQFAAARAAHQAMKDGSDSPEWLDVLARSYAHLSALTNHTWSSHSDAFAARALLYAERAVVQAKGEPLPRWSRAYVYAVLGLHGLALDEVEAISDLPDGDAEPPAWATLVRPIAEFDHPALDKCAELHPELAEVAAYAQWNLYYCYLHGRWVYEKGRDAMDACPEAYGVYSALANWDALMVKRLGAGAGASAFGKLLPRRMAKFESLPKKVRALTVTTPDFIGGLFGTSRTSYLSPRPIEIARALKKESLKGPVEEFSWPILAELIAEEQFAQAANHLRVSRDAVEHSKESLVASLRPLVEGHRYAPFIESHAFSPHQQEESKAELRKITVVDPRGVMVNMLGSVWDVPVAGLQCGTELGVNAAAHRSRTVPALLEADHELVLRWTKHFNDENHNSILADFAAISPYAPQAQRLKFAQADDPDMETVKGWEAKLRDDPLVWMAAAWQYKRLGENDNAIRCYQRSLDISPCMDATRSLAAIYYTRGNKEQWEETLKSYLREDDLSLTHAEIHRDLANEHISLRAWKQAEPHALEAAQTYSSWGLLLASRVYEGMRDAKSSEHFAAEASRSYPSHYNGTEWYFWTQRNGVGDRDGAREIAEQSIAVAQSQQSYDSHLRVALYRWMEGDLAAALEHVEGPLQQTRDSADPWTRAYNLLIAAVIAAELEDTAAVERSVAAFRGLIDAEEVKKYPNWVAMYGGLADAFSGKVPAEDFYETFEKAVAESDDDVRCDYCYLLGAALEHAGEAELSDKYYGLAAFQPPFTRYTATLAGRRLAARHGADRGGLPEKYAEVEKVAEAKWRAASEEKDRKQEDSAKEEAAMDDETSPTAHEGPEA